MTLTLGVEEEFLLVDPTTGRPIRAAGPVLALAGTPEDGSVQAELLDTQVEAATGVCTLLAEVEDQLLGGRRRLAEAARSQGLVLVSTGTPVFEGAMPGLVDQPRFTEFGRRYAGIIDDYQVSGCHVEVGVPDREAGVAVMNHLRPWLPTLLALSGNSVFWAGRDMGHASWRVVLQSRFPGAGMAPHFDSADDYNAEIARLAECGTLVHEELGFWLLRPSARHPTLEFRVADAVPTAAEATLQAALSRALVHTALSEVDRGVPAPVVRDQVGHAAVWTAARYGLHGDAVHPLRERRVPATELLEEMLAWVAPALEELGDADRVRSVLAPLRQHGIGADRQRKAFEHGPHGVLDYLAGEVDRAEPRLDVAPAG
ncbi:carboxylate-amine ligase [Crossiella equi]|uniref:Putative glutamate--cysteine ligase 2 n=1 Tax=Crossiella equi TaxID=130796 RepID=A0ABS5A551_9PSEU|nr:glutamate--cysteine ligase [Crossiella equi]MBP2471712.1 carboxylate-amine ligase [Crossiella equi]